MANGGGAVVGNTGKRLPSKLQWSRKTIFLASGLNLAGELFLPSQSPRLLSTTHGDTVCCLFPTQIGFAVSQLNSLSPNRVLYPWIEPSDSLSNHFCFRIKSISQLCSFPNLFIFRSNACFPSFLAKIRTHFLSKWVQYSPIRDTPIRAGTCLLQIQESHTSVARLATRAALHEFWIF